MTDLDQFTRAYIEAALWSSTDDADRPMDDNYSVADLAPETLERMVADCARFQTEHADYITDDNPVYQTKWDATDMAGHDFWLTRNGHGCGFWDGDWTEPAASIMTEASRKYGECSLYVGDDGRLYL